MTLSKASQAIIQVLKLTRGRDKICRLFQYTTRFLAAMIRRPSFQKYFSTPAQSQLWFDNFRAVGASCALTRRIFRFSRYQDILKRIKTNKEILNNKSKQTRPVFYYLSKIMSDLFLFLYYLMDNILFFYELELIPKTNLPLFQWIDWGADFCWVIESVFDIVINLSDVRFAFSEQKKEKLNKLFFDFFVLILDLLVYLLDCYWFH